MHDKRWRDAFFASMQALMRDHYDGDVNAACLSWASITSKAIEHVTGERAVFQAGTASWPIISESEDDGVRPTNYSYMWEPGSERTLQQMSNLALPELHAWVALPDRNEVVDFTLGAQREMCKKLAGYEPTIAFPDYFWGNAEDAERLKYVYIPCPMAIDLCLTYLLTAPYPFTWFVEDMPIEYSKKG